MQKLQGFSHTDLAAVYSIMSNDKKFPLTYDEDKKKQLIISLENQSPGRLKTALLQLEERKARINAGLQNAAAASRTQPARAPTVPLYQTQPTRTPERTVQNQTTTTPQRTVPLYQQQPATNQQHPGTNQQHPGSNQQQQQQHYQQHPGSNQQQQQQHYQQHPGTNQHFPPPNQQATIEQQQKYLDDYIKNQNQLLADQVRYIEVSQQQILERGYQEAANVQKQHNELLELFKWEVADLERKIIYRQNNRNGEIPDVQFLYNQLIETQRGRLEAFLQSHKKPLTPEQEILQRRLEAEAAQVNAEKVRINEANAHVEAEKARINAANAHVEAEKAKIDAEKARLEKKKDQLQRMESDLQREKEYQSKKRTVVEDSRRLSGEPVKEVKVEKGKYHPDSLRAMVDEPKSILKKKEVPIKIEDQEIITKLHENFREFISDVQRKREDRVPVPNEIVRALTGYYNVRIRAYLDDPTNPLLIQVNRMLKSLESYYDEKDKTTYDWGLLWNGTVRSYTSRHYKLNQMLVDAKKNNVCTTCIHYFQELIGYFDNNGLGTAKKS
jgi:hypothetical protein